MRTTSYIYRIYHFVQVITCSVGRAQLMSYVGLYALAGTSITQAPKVLAWTLQLKSSN